MSYKLSEDETRDPNQHELIFEDKASLIKFVSIQKKTQFWLEVNVRGEDGYHSSVQVSRKSVIVWLECCIPRREELKVKVRVTPCVLGNGKFDAWIHPLEVIIPEDT
jgi:hypothetical protein